ncbi:MAG: transcriptional regulator, partial [Oscillospiraceae bacterium]|nr:transcriptional regulator [Oscillospiraceae bacterium]
DIYGLTVSEADGEVCLKVNKGKGKYAAELLKILCAWKEQADKLSSEEISRKEYDNWRYHYPQFDTTQIWAKVPSQELSDTLVEAFQDKLKKDE